MIGVAMRVRTAADLGRLIREARIDLGITQSALAARIGSTQTWVSEIENGKPTAQIGLVLNVMDVLDIALDGKTRLQQDLAETRQTRDDFGDYPDINTIVDGPKA
jgi:HTH-type transcriptional regulator/antitoxin HipB